MKELSSSNFGLLIAYLVPGLTTLWGVSQFSPTVRSWLLATPPDAPSIGGFLYLTVGSVAAGLTVSTIRWAVIDSLHHATGLRPPKTDYSALQQHIDAYHAFVELKYRYYQFYANMVVALAIVYAAGLGGGHDLTTSLPAHAGFLLLVVIFLAGSRDTLRKYYKRLAQLLGTSQSRLPSRYASVKA